MAHIEKDIAIATEFRDRRHREERKHRLNREIMAPEVRLSGPENEPLGIVSLAELPLLLRRLCAG